MVIVFALVAHRQHGDQAGAFDFIQRYITRETELDHQFMHLRLVGRYFAAGKRKGLQEIDSLTDSLTRTRCRRHILPGQKIEQAL